jgi:hypothetical protein
VNPFAAVVVPPAEAEAGLPDPHAGADPAQVQLDAGLLGKLALACLGGGLVGLQAPAGQLPPAVAGFSWVVGVHEQQPVVWVQQQHARAKARAVAGRVARGKLSGHVEGHGHSHKPFVPWGSNACRRPSGRRDAGGSARQGVRTAKGALS